MAMFEEPSFAFIMGAALAFAAFLIQLLLCLKVRIWLIRWLPTGLLAVCAVFLVLLGSGAFGDGTGFIGSVHILTAIILAVPIGFVALGVLAAWLIYVLYRLWGRQDR